jgi:alpha-D-xyloside xylohydrolase
MNDAVYTSTSYATDYRPEKSIYQDDTRIFHRAGFSYDSVAAVTRASFTDGVLTAHVTLDSGAPALLTVTIVVDGILRLRFWPADAIADFEETSEMLVPLATEPPVGTFTEQADAYTLTVGDYALWLHKEPFGMEILHCGARIFELETEKLAGKYVTPPLGFRSPGSEAYISWRMQNNERFFGLGEKWNKVEKTSTRATIWAADTCGSNTTDMSYKSLPLLFSTKGWGMLLHTGYRSFWEVGTFSYTSGSALVEDNKLDLFLFLVPTLKALIGLYTGLTGKPQMPPRWALGVWMSRCVYSNRAEVEAVQARLRAEHIPCDVVHLDPSWMKTHYYHRLGVDACDFEWNDEAWPDHKQMLRQWLADGFSTCFWVNPYIPEDTALYEEAKAKDYLLKTADGATARLEHGEPVGTVDFTNPMAKTWWKDHLKALVDEGASVFKPDYGDRVAEEAIFANGKTGKEMHNRFMFLYTEAAFEAVKETRGENIVWRRSGYIGSQRYPGTWAGDTQVTWQGMRGALRGGLSAGFGGEAFWSHDIGGFVGDKPDPELYIRWAQFGLLSSFCRFHGTTPREPWEYGDEALDIVRHYAQLRYVLMPYLLAAARESTVTGLPMLRHMQIEFPGEPNIDTIDDQYMLGPDLLVAPVLLPDATSRYVYFPKGRWWSLEDVSCVVDGPGFVEVAAPLERIPIFVRTGAVIPRYIHEPQHLKAPAPEEMELFIYPGPSQKSLCIAENGFDIQIAYAATAEQHTLTIVPVPLTFTTWLMDTRVVKVQSVHDALTTWEVFEKETMINLVADDGVEVLFW